MKKWVPGFYVKPGDTLIIKHCLINFGKGGVLNKQRAFIYNEFVNTVEENQSRVTEKEYELAVRLSRIKKLKLETIMSEVAELKKFGKEVGLGFSDMKGLDEDELIQAIIAKVDPKKQKYSKEFVEWYESLDEDLFEDNGKKKSKKEEEEFDVDDIKDVIENADKVKELHEVIETYPDQFNQKWLKIKDMEELQEKMMEVVEEYEEEKGKSKKKEKDKKKGKEESVELSKKEKKELVELIQETDDKDDLKSIIKEYPSIFEEIELRGKSTAETLQKKMLACLGVEVEEEDDDEKPKKKDKKKSKESDLEEELNEMGFIELKKYAKKAGVSVKPGTNKADTIAMILEAAEGGSKKKSKKEEIEINPSMVKSLVKEKDLDALQEAAKEMDIKLSALEKRSCKAIGEKLIEALSEADDDEKPKKKDKKKSKESVWSKVRELVEEGEKPKKIKKVIAEMLEELGIEEDEAEEKAAVLIEIAQAEAGE